MGDNNLGMLDILIEESDTVIILANLYYLVTPLIDLGKFVIIVKQVETKARVVIFPIRFWLLHDFCLFGFPLSSN